MIKPHCFQKKWLDSFRAQKQYSRINPPLLEKMVHAFSLLQNLQTQGLSLKKYTGQDIAGLNIENQNWNSLNRLKRFPDQSAYFYWYKCLDTLKQLTSET